MLLEVIAAGLRRCPLVALNEALEDYFGNPSGGFRVVGTALAQRLNQNRP